MDWSGWVCRRGLPATAGLDIASYSAKRMITLPIHQKNQCAPEIHAGGVVALRTCLSLQPPPHLVKTIHRIPFFKKVGTWPTSSNNGSGTTKKKKNAIHLRRLFFFSFFFFSLPTFIFYNPVAVALLLTPRNLLANLIPVTRQPFM